MTRGLFGGEALARRLTTLTIAFILLALFAAALVEVGVCVYMLIEGEPAGQALALLAYRVLLLDLVFACAAARRVTPPPRPRRRFTA